MQMFSMLPDYTWVDSCNQQKGGWECGYYVMYWIFYFVTDQQYDFPANVSIIYVHSVPLNKFYLSSYNIFPFN